MTITAPSGDHLSDVHVCNNTVDGQQVEFIPREVGMYLFRFDTHILAVTVNIELNTYNSSNS